MGAFVITRATYAMPGGFTDVFYHFNAANRLVSGQGLTDTYLWTYIGAPDKLPAPSHLYWMPLTSLSAALGMALLNAPGNYAAAQWPFALMFAGVVCTGFWLGGRLGKTRRHAWVAGLLTLFSGFYTRFWGATDTFAPYALVGALCLVFIGLALEPQSSASSRENEQRPTRRLLYFALAGAFAALGHLTRADGLLLLMVGWAAALWPSRLFARFAHREGQTDIPVLSLQARLIGVGVMTLAYLLVMLPWFARNLNALGTPLPVGGTQSIWFREYDDLFNYPPNSTPATFFQDGVGTLFSTRLEVLPSNIGTFVAVEGLIIMTPLMLVGLWKRRRAPLLRGFWLYALGVHLAMTVVFPYPGFRGGLLHSAAALVPWWAALGVVGLDDCVEWMARRRRRWNAGSAKVLFSVALVGIAVFLSMYIALPNRIGAHDTPAIYQELKNQLPPDARVMINDPAQLYYYTGLGGVVLPNEPPDVIPQIASKYGVGYLVLEQVTPDGRASTASSPKLWPILTSNYPFLTPLPLNVNGYRLYAIHP
jgi:hypothetical protein